MRKWSGARVAILGGDAREHEIIRNFLENGCSVSTYGVMPGQKYADLAKGSALEAVAGMDIIVTPNPAAAPGDFLYAPHAPERIQVNRELLGAARRGAFYLAGHVSQPMREAGAEFGIQFRTVAQDDYMQVLHSIPTVEGSISIAIQNTEDTIHGSRALVVGYGRNGSRLAAVLRGMGARVAVAARRPEVRIRAFADGAEETCDTDPEILAEAASRAYLIFETAPSRLVTREVLARVAPDALVIDMAGPPGGVDHEAAKELGVRTIWARSQAGTAPRHSGRAQFDVMERILDAEYGRDA